MCYSAQVESKWKRYAREMEAQLAWLEFQELARQRLSNPSQFRLPRGFDLEFAAPESESERVIADLVTQHRESQVMKVETEIFAQKKRLADAERKLAVKETKAAVESGRIAANKIQQGMGKLSLLTDERPHANDYRIFPRNYAPILIMREGRKLLVPARYLLRQPGNPVLMDDKLSGNYNARRDNLTRFWRQQFGTSHAVMAIQSFYENVAAADGQNVVLHFNPKPAGVMLIACLFAEWSDPKTGERLLSFAAVTDEPPAEVAAAAYVPTTHGVQTAAPPGATEPPLQAVNPT